MAFKTWNQNMFGDVHRHVCMAIDEVNRIQQLRPFTVKYSILGA